MFQTTKQKSENSHFSTNFRPICHQTPWIFTFSHPFGPPPVVFPVAKRGAEGPAMRASAPVRTKIPVPMQAPMPSSVSSSAVRRRGNSPSSLRDHGEGGR